MRSAIEAWMSLPLFLCVVVGDNSMRKTLDWLLRPVLVRERQKEDGRGMKKKKRSRRSQIKKKNFFSFSWKAMVKSQRSEDDLSLSCGRVLRLRNDNEW